MPPTLDVSEVLTDPDISDTFTVIRRPEVVNAAGRSKVPAPVTHAGVVGVVCAADPDDLERLDDQDRGQRAISVVTQFRLRSASKDGSGQNFKPDIIEYDGGRFVVRLIDPYTRYGNGFVQAIAVSIGLQESPPT